MAALLNVYSGEVIRRALGSKLKSYVKLSDSQIILYWLLNEDKPLKQWVRNRVVEILRFTNLENWYHVDSKNMLADLGTRRKTTISDVSPDSVWINGYEWMKGDVKEMPITICGK